MYIRIEFENLGSDATKETQSLFFGSPNGMFLTSMNASMISWKELRDAVGLSVVFWYIDVDVVNKYYAGVINCLYNLRKYPGVSQVDVLPLEGEYKNYRDKFDDLTSILTQYIDGVKGAP